jgi:hypothetical protein
VCELSDALGRLTAAAASRLEELGNRYIELRRNQVERFEAGQTLRPLDVGDCIDRSASQLGKLALGELSGLPDCPKLDRDAALNDSVRSRKASIRLSPHCGRHRLAAMTWSQRSFGN